MNIYKISQTGNDDYDTYDSAIVAAESTTIAKFIHPAGDVSWDGKEGLYSSWCNVSEVEVEFIGQTKISNRCVILASFNAG